ncbi:Ig-like domain-containing protein, partial [Sphingorhabdus sp.]|uniref:Ig-like domain-containing protein n=1 Tax=Sphingorhabdus sp. TaxID=1902408 RepID=UPI0037C8A08C
MSEIARVAPNGKRSESFSSPSDDYSNTAATTGVVSIESAPTTGTIEVADDVDAFRVYLTAGATYTFNLNATSGSLDPLLSLYNSNLTLLAFNDDFGSSNNSQITFTATSSGAYYLAAEGFSGTGAYSLRATTTAADDYANNTATTGVVTIGGAAITGTINYLDDDDLFRVSLTAGVTYTFNLNATSGSYDPYLSLYDSNLTRLAYNDDFGSSLNSQITFTATSSGTYYLQAASFGTDAGTYSLQGGAQATDTTAPTVRSFSPTDAATGVAVGNNIVLTFSEAIARGTGTITIRSGSATGTIVESFDAATSNRISISGSTLTIDPTNNLAGNTRYFVVFSSGNIRDLAGNAYRGTSTYDFTTGSAPTTTSDDYSNTAATTGVVSIESAPTTGTIEVADDVDAFRVYLTAGATYTFNLNATSGSLDPLLSLYNSNLTLLAFNDDFGSSNNSQITFTATSSGAYYLAAEGFSGTGAYSLRATTTAADDYANNTATTGVVTIGGAAITGTINYLDDDDLFRVSLTAGVTYTFNLNATSGSYDPYLSLYDSNLTRLAYNDDFGSSLNSQITFTATSSGTYYLQAASFGTDAGTYSLQGGAQATDTTAPTVRSFSPTDAATGVAVGNNIVLTFSEAIARGTGTITIRSGSATGTIVESFDAATS